MRWARLLRVLPAGIAMAVLTSAVQTGLANGMPTFHPPAAIMWSVATVLGLVGLTVWWARAPRWVLWVGAWALPVALAGIHLTDLTFAPMQSAIQHMVVTQLVNLTLGALTLYVFVDGPRLGGWRRLLPFAGAVALTEQLVMAGYQVVFPGAVLFLALCLMPVVAVRAADDDSWLVASLQAIQRSPASWLVVLTAAALGLVAPLALEVGLVGWEASLAALLDPLARSPGLQLTSDLQARLFQGLGLAVACVLYDQRVET